MKWNDLGVNLPIIVINSKFGRISYRFLDIDALSSIIPVAGLPTPSIFDTPYRRNALRYQRNLYTAEKYI